MSPHHSDQMSQRSQVSRVALCMSKVKVTHSVSDWVSESVTRSPIEPFWTAENWKKELTKILIQQILWFGLQLFGGRSANKFGQGPLPFAWAWPERIFFLELGRPSLISYLRKKPLPFPRKITFSEFLGSEKVGRVKKWAFLPPPPKKKKSLI